MKLFAFMLISIFSQAQSIMETPPVSKGEELKFKLTYGWFTIGRGTFLVQDKDVERDGRNCMQIDVTGRAAGLAGLFSKFDDSWGAVIDTETFIPYYSYRDLSEGDSDLKEEVVFDYENDQIVFNQSSETDDKTRPTKYYDLAGEQIFDMMGGLMYARSLDYEKLTKGDTIELSAFFDKKFYDFKMVYHGKERVKTKIGKIRCYKVVPIMEKNKIFLGEDSITFWLSADTNRLPLKVKARVKFGTAYCELTSYKNVKSGIDSK